MADWDDSSDSTPRPAVIPPRQRRGGMYSRAFQRSQMESNGAAGSSAPFTPAPAAAAVEVVAPPTPRSAAPSMVRPGGRPAGLAVLIAVAVAFALTGLLTWNERPDVSAPPDAVIDPWPAAGQEAAPIEAAPPESSAADVPVIQRVAAAPAAPEVRPARPASKPRDGSLRIESQPPGARVTVNGVGWGVTPLTIGYVPLGQKQVRVLKDGFVSAERTVRLDAESPGAMVRVTLRPR